MRWYSSVSSDSSTISSSRSPTDFLSSSQFYSFFFSLFCHLSWSMASVFSSSEWIKAKKRVDHVHVHEENQSPPCYFGWGNSKKVPIRRRRVSITLLFLSVREGIVRVFLILSKFYDGWSTSKTMSQEHGRSSTRPRCTTKAHKI